MGACHVGSKSKGTYKKRRSYGVIGSKAPHVLSIEERKNVLETDQMFVDIGASSKEEAESFGVRVGDPIATICPFEVLLNPKLLWLVIGITELAATLH
ncbi:hypothetical protein GCM10009865_54620 [Aeromicrobium ponti]